MDLMDNNTRRQVNAQIGWALLIMFILIRLLNAAPELALLIVGTWFVLPFVIVTVRAQRAARDDEGR